MNPIIIMKNEIEQNRVTAVYHKCLMFNNLNNKSEIALQNRKKQNQTDLYLYII